MEYWLYAALVIGLACIGLAYFQARRSDAPDGMRNVF
jgi:hypothetical protein